MELREYFYPQDNEFQPNSGRVDDAENSLEKYWEFEIDNNQQLIDNQYSLETFELSPNSSMEKETTSGNRKDQHQCHVCDSPTANTLHFGGRSCKACAAFFRRSVSMSMTYECIGNDAIPNCKIHFELRMLCRHCRFIKCLKAGMKNDLVQAKKEEVRVAKRRSKGLVRCVEAKKETMDMHEYIEHYAPQKSSTPRSEPESELNVVDVFVPVNSTDLGISSIVSLSPPPSAPQTQHVMHDPSSVGSSERSVYDSQQASTSNAYYVEEVYNVEYIPSPSVNMIDNRGYDVIDHYVRTEASLNDRRRIMYTDTQIRDVFDTLCECPYERHHLKMFNYQTFCGFVKHDFVMILDYVNQFPDFSKLMRNEKNAFYRMACAVDSMISSAYYTYRTGIAESRLVLFNGDYISMDPAPVSGDEPGAAKHFDNDADHMKYKTLMPLKLKQYFDMAVPFSCLGISFEEFVLLKALTIWHISHYKLLEEGRSICSRQRDAIIKALYRVVEDKGEENPAVRIGQLLLSMSYIMEQVQAMTSSYLMITFFDVVTCDSILHDLLSFTY